MIGKELKKILAVICSLSICLGTFSGCFSDDEEDEEYFIVANETISPDSKWVNSEIVGAIDNTLETNLKDDFFTAVNCDWILENQDLGDEQLKSPLFDASDKVKNGLIDIFKNMDFEDNTNDVGLDEEEFAHDKQLLSQYESMVADWDTRNSLGVEVLRPYLDAIENVTTLQEMSTAFTDYDNINFSYIDLATVEVGNDPNNTSMYASYISAANAWSLANNSQVYSNYPSYYKYKKSSDAIVKNILGRLGYSESEIEENINRCIDFELKLSEYAENNDRDFEYYLDKDSSKIYLTADELQNLVGEYPITETIKKSGSPSERFYVRSLEYLKCISKVYCEENLEEIKSYLLINTVIRAADSLDRESYDVFMENTIEEEEEEEQIATQAEKEQDEWDIIIDYISEYLNGVATTVYVAEYCTAEKKERITELTNNTINSFREVINEEEWLDEDEKAKAVEKLDNITSRVLYPDEFVSYMDLDFNDCDNLIEMNQKITNYINIKQNSWSDKPIDKDVWDFDYMPTTVINACYMPAENSINIFVGITECDEVYSDELTDEQLMGTLGTIIGHEITHGFDNNGVKFDKNGDNNNIWDTQTIAKYSSRTIKLINYYNSLTPYPNSSFYSGSMVSGEAIADMGGMRIQLHAAESMEGFDYDEFFKAYAKLWREVTTYDHEKNQADSDGHPLDYLRVNVTCQQFDEFIETYGLEEGDGMYLSDLDRIRVW